MSSTAHGKTAFEEFNSSKIIVIYQWIPMISAWPVSNATTHYWSWREEVLFEEATLGSHKANQLSGKVACLTIVRQGWRENDCSVPPNKYIAPNPLPEDSLEALWKPSYVHSVGNKQRSFSVSTSQTNKSCVVHRKHSKFHHSWSIPDTFFATLEL
jgi:hypothetical protein